MQMQIDLFPRLAIFRGLAALTALSLAPAASAQVCPLRITDVGGGVTATVGSSRVNAMVRFDDGTGEALYIGGLFTHAGGTAASNLVRWDGTSFTDVAGGLDGEVSSLAVHDADGTGAGAPALYVGGSFTLAGGVAATSIARFDGTSWSALGSGTNGAVLSMTSFDPDGAGPGLPNLFVCGNFTVAGGIQAFFTARWGSSWTALGSGTNSTTRVVTIFDDGSGPALYFGGGFSTADGVARRMIARWKSSGWETVGGPLVATFGIFSNVYSLCPFDDGSGPALFVGGDILTADGIAVNNIPRWDGTSWSATGGGLHNGAGFGSVRSLGVFDDGAGPALFAGGSFTVSGPNNLSNLARWNGAAWEDVRGGADQPVSTLMVFDAALHLGGLFANTDGAPVNRLARLEADVLSPTSYCALTVDSIGCTPTVSSSGAPSLSAGGGFMVTASSVRNNKSGVLVYGLNGRAMIAYRGGTLCLKSPLIRTRIQNSGGSAAGDDCTGTFSFDFAAHVAAAGNPAFLCGTRVNVQYFSRDPGGVFPNNLSMSNAMKFEIVP